MDNRTLGAWERYFSKNFPELKLVLFSAFTIEDQKRMNVDRIRRMGRRKYENAQVT